MRIGIFTDTYPPYINGVSTSIVMLQHALEKLGHEVFIVTVNPENMKYQFDNDNKIIRIPGVPIGIYDYRLTGIYPLRAIETIKKWNLDIIHSHTEFGIGTFARIMAKQLDIPLVHTYHTMYEDYVHYITKGYFQRSSKKIVEYLTKFYCDKTATELIVPTKKTYDLFKQKYKYDRNVHIVPTGIEVERFYSEQFKEKEINDLRKKLGIRSNEDVILFVGRLGEEKNVNTLIEAHVSITRTNPNTKLLIVGTGPDLDNFKELARKYGVTKDVIFAGRVPWEEVPKYYQVATLFATASKTETQGLTVIEAMAASLPVVAYDDEAFRDVVIDGLNGHLFQTKKGYKDAVRDILDHPDTYEQMCRQARIIADQHSSKYFAEQVLDVYRTAFRGNPISKDRTFLGKMKDVAKKGFYGK